MEGCSAEVEGDTMRTMTRKIVNAILVVGGLGMLLYVGAYALLTAKGCPAVDAQGVVRYKTSIARCIDLRHLDGVTTGIGRPCWLNEVFLPLDEIYYRFDPANFECRDSITNRNFRFGTRSKLGKQ